MQRLSRAGREQAIMDAIKRLTRETRVIAFTKGEICRKMGIISTSKIRDILDDMVKDQKITKDMVDVKGYKHRIACYAIVVWEQTRLPDHDIVINGQTCRMSDMEVYYNVLL